MPATIGSHHTHGLRWKYDQTVIPIPIDTLAQKRLPPWTVTATEPRISGGTR